MLFFANVAVVAAFSSSMGGRQGEPIDTVALHAAHKQTIAASKENLNSIKSLPPIIAAFSGIITEFIGATFLFIYRSTMQQATNYSKTLERINSVGRVVVAADGDA